MPLTFIRQDITHMEVDAIVNAANTELRMGGGVCGAIFRAAGPTALTAACAKLAPIKTGQAVITPGFHLPAKYVIHAAGPVYQPSNPERSAELLRSAYLSSLRLATEHHLKSIAFPLISAGIYGFPPAEALRVAIGAIRDYLNSHDLDVFLVFFDRHAVQINQYLWDEVADYLDENYFPGPVSQRSLLEVEATAIYGDSGSGVPLPAAISPAPPGSVGGSKRTRMARSKTAAPASVPAGLDQAIGSLEDTFTTTLLRLIDAKGVTDVEVYKRANLDRRLFSKIRARHDYMPSKRTAIALAVALHLDILETADLIGRAGYALSPSSKFDVIVEYFLKSSNFDIFEINEVLFKYEQPLLGY